MKLSLLLAACVTVGTLWAAPEAPKAKKPDESTTSKLLERMGEGTVGEWPGRAGQSSSARYRISRLSMGSSLQCIKLFSTTERQGKAGPFTTRHEMEVKSGSFHSPEIEKEVFAVPAKAYRELTMTFFNQELFSLPEKQEILHGIVRGGNDGTTWVFEYWTGQDCRVVRRWSPEAGPARVCADAIVAFLDEMQKRP